MRADDLKREVGSRSGLLVLCIATAVFGVVSVCAQPTSAPPRTRDPLMSLMLAQPKLDFDTPVRVEATFDPPRAVPNQPVVYRITLNALKTGIIWSGRPPEVPGLDFRAGASGEIMQMAGTNMQPRSSFNFHARPGRPGTYVVPEFAIRVYGAEIKVPATVLVVSPSASLVPAQKLVMDVSPPNPFVGEAARVRILSPVSPSGIVQALAQVTLNGSGFMQEVTANRQTVETAIVDGRPAPHFVYETMLTPIMAGRQEVFAQAFAVGNRFSGSIIITGPAIISGATHQYTLLDSDPVRLNFRPLPPEGRLPGFAGAVGDYVTELPRLSTNVVRVGEPVKLTVAVKGRGNLGRLSMPPAPRLADWQILDPKPEQLPPQVIQSRGFVNFTYTLVPLHDGVERTPELPFSFFHPDREEYVSENVRPVPVKVLPGEKPADLARLLRQRARSEDARKEPALGSIATTTGVSAATLTPLQLRPWFPVLQLAPGVLFAGLMVWDRRRRYLEAHPNIVLRRRARRALHRHRRQMRKQNRWGNDPGFADAALSGIRVVSAPHYPAAPGAVTSGDVIALLDNDAPGNAREVVANLFRFTNERRFSPADSLVRPGKLPPLVEVERVLDYLEARL